MKYRQYSKRKLMIAMLVLASGAQVACDDHNWMGDGFRGRSDQFVYRDVNRDDKITRTEWERIGGTIVGDPYLVWFDQMDCEGDGVVTWSEYYRYNWYKRNRCARVSGPYPSGIKDRNFDTQKRWQSPTFCLPQAAFEESVNGHTEQDITPEQAIKVELACSKLAKGSPPVVGRVTNRCSVDTGAGSPTVEKLFSDISVINDNPDVSITLIRFSITSGMPGNIVGTEKQHIKTVVVAPNSAETFRAWFESDEAVGSFDEQISCTLDSVRAGLL